MLSKIELAKQYHCIKHYEWLDTTTLELQLIKNRLRISFLEPSIIRCHYYSGPVFEVVPSYGVAKDYKLQAVPLEEYDHLVYHEIRTPELILRIRKLDAGIEFYERKSGRLLSADADGMGLEQNKKKGCDILWVHKHMPQKAHFYGLGDKPCDLNLRGKRFKTWCSDHYSFNPNSDPLYKAIPFFLCLNEGLSYGIFYDSTMECYFDFGKTNPEQLTFGADGGEMDYYFIGGASGLHVVENYTRLTGLPPMPPMWALGYQQSRWSYYPERKVEELSQQIREKRIPCDVIYMDTHHMKQNQSFTWNKSYFPKPEIMIENLESKGFKIVCIVNPGIKINPDNYVWRSGYERKIFCRRLDGELLTGRVWPGECNFPDFTNPETRHWWMRLFHNQIACYGVRGIWVDMNEPVIFPDATFPADTRHAFDGHSCSHLKAHNVYGQCMANATRMGMECHAPARRPFVLSRAGYAGMQRYAATWTGDNFADWENLKMANLMIQRLATSGVSFAGSDTGGFLGYPTPELFCRWMQLSAFQPLFRNHCNGEFGGQEPWCFGEMVEEYSRRAIEERYRLMPYLYTQFYRYTTQGTPMIRSLALMHSENEDTYWRSSEFYLGDSLYIVPVHHPGETRRSLYLAPGQWYHYWNDKPIYSTGREYWVPTPMQHIPVYVRGGHVIPIWPIQQYVGELANPATSYDLWWAADTQEQSYHYEDAGDGMGYRIGQYLYHQYNYSANCNSFKLQQSCKGSQDFSAEEVEFRIHGIPEGATARLLLDGHREIQGHMDDKHVLHLLLPASFKQLDLSF